MQSLTQLDRERNVRGTFSKYLHVTLEEVEVNKSTLREVFTFYFHPLALSLTSLSPLLSSFFYNLRLRWSVDFVERV